MNDGKEPATSARVYSAEEERNSGAALEQFVNAYVKALNAENDDAERATRPLPSDIDTSTEDDRRNREHVAECDLRFSRIAVQFVSAEHLARAVNELAIAMLETWASGSETEQWLLDTDPCAYAERFFKSWSFPS